MNFAIDPNNSNLRLLEMFFLTHPKFELPEFYCDSFLFRFLAFFFIEQKDGNYPQGSLILKLWTLFPWENFIYRKMMKFDGVAKIII